MGGKKVRLRRKKLENDPLGHIKLFPDRFTALVANLKWYLMQNTIIVPFIVKRMIKTA